MNQGATVSTKLKMAPPPLKKGRVGIDQATFRVVNCVEVAEDLGTGIPGRNCHGGIGYVTKVEGAGSNTIVSVKYSSTAKITRTESVIPLSRVKAGFLPLHQWRWKATKIQSIPQYQSSMP